MQTSFITLSAFKRPRFHLPLIPNFSAWLTHAPFAFYLVESHRPRVIVELGSHYGFSYLCFCQQVRDMNLATECYAIDTWQGDEHSGHYTDEVYDVLKLYHDPNYGKFSRLVRSKFIDALDSFEDGSIDLLHIDGRHFYEDVKEDFESWFPKLSDRAIVLFHDTQVRDRNFGVYRLWDELRHKYRNFEFLHGHGLGVLAVGSSISENYNPLLSKNLSSNDLFWIRKIYDDLGNSILGLEAQFENYEPSYLLF